LPDAVRFVDLISEELERTDEDFESWTDINFNSEVSRAGGYRRVLLSYIKPIELFFSISLKLSEELDLLIKRIHPKFIWAEHVFALAALNKLDNEIPIIYSHHDWLYKILRLRNPNMGLSDKLINLNLRRLENQLVKNAELTVTGTGGDELKALQQISQTYCLKTLYDKAYLSDVKISSMKVSINHLGSLRTSSNYLGLMHFLKYVYPSIRNDLDGNFVKIKLIGDYEGAKNSLLGRISNVRNLELYGHINDLSSVMNFADLSIIPYKYNSGYRTKVPLLLRYGQIIIAYQKAVAGYEDILTYENSRIVDNDEEFARAILNLIDDEKLRLRLAKNATDSYNLGFDIKVESSKLSSIIDTRILSESWSLPYE